MEVAGANRRWRWQFRFAVHLIWSRVPELWTLGGIEIYVCISIHSKSVWLDWLLLFQVLSRSDTRTLEEDDADPSCY